ncbi:MAG: tRNA pseudouridine(38-40) synthase TruA [Oscillospiraceae bacterium]|nr:tRNA pseudouridine(38-40) synthase TruA [Oscillospiraceae bacterium]
METPTVERGDIISPEGEIGSPQYTKTKRILLTIRFDGEKFYGWQAQNGGNTVQQTLQDAVQSVFGERLGISGCGRTDAGVHAYGYCCHLDIRSDFDTGRLPNAINRYFISREIKIAVTDAKEVDKDFHSRYYIETKEYIYKIQNDKYKDPFYLGKALHYYKPLDVNKMREASKYILGEHNFACFMGDKSDIPADEAVRIVYKIGIESEVTGSGNNIINIYMSANGFLYKMARIIAGTLVEVSEGKIDLRDLPDIITSRDRSRAGRTLPPCGLYLNKIEYMDKTGYWEKIENYNKNTNKAEKYD